MGGSIRRMLWGAFTALVVLVVLGVTLNLIILSVERGQELQAINTEEPLLNAVDSMDAAITTIHDSRQPTRIRQLHGALRPLMHERARVFAVSAALLLALATAVGALGAHLLRTRLAPGGYEILQTAVHYQFFHALGLLAISLLLDRAPGGALRAAAWLLLVGVVLFSGSLYALLAGAPRWLGVLTPLGGLSLIGGWCLAALGLRAAVHLTPDER